MKIETVLLLANPIAGRGRALCDAEELQLLLGAEVQTELVKTKRVYEPGELNKLFAGKGLAVVLGGDGSIAPLLSTLAETQLPIFAWPGGNESLFSREFGMTNDAVKLLQLMREPRFGAAYYGAVGDSSFFHMVSMGFDSEIVQAVSTDRAGPVGKQGYLLPIVRTIASYRAPEISLTVDGVQQLQRERGYLIVANSGQYAGGVRPVPEASCAQNRLHARFYPYPSILKHLPWLFAYPGWRAVDSAESRHFCGTEFKISLSDLTYPIQADGDLIGRGSCRIRAAERAIRVLSGR